MRAYKKIFRYQINKKKELQAMNHRMVARILGQVLLIFASPSFWKRK